MAELIVKLGDQEIQRIPFNKPIVTIGRSSENDIVIENLSISRKHAELRMDNDMFLVADLNSSNGTRVNGLPVTESEVEDGDIIGVGKHNLILSAPEGVPMPKAGVDGIDMQQTIALTPSMEDAFLTVRPPRQNGRVIQLEDNAARVGRAVDNDIRIVDWFIEPYQAVVERSGAEYRFRNMPDAPSAYLRDEAIDDVVLSDGDVIKIGTTQLVYTTSLQAAELAREHRLPVGSSSAALVADNEPILGSDAEDDGGGSDNGKDPATSDVETHDTGMEAQAQEAESEPDVFDDVPTEMNDDGLDLEPIDVSISLDSLEEELSDDLAEQEDHEFLNPLDSVNYPLGDSQEVSDFDLSDIPDETGDVVPKEVPELSIEEDLDEDMDFVDSSAPTGEMAIDTTDNASEEAIGLEPIEPMSDIEEASYEEADEMVDIGDEPVGEDSVSVEEMPGELDDEQDEDAGVDEDRQVAMWKRMLDNPSEAVRNQARKQLERLTDESFD
jgi:pSer/pThr/pTyr-binding forkhead associated (FHA) protein